MNVANMNVVKIILVLVFGLNTIVFAEEVNVEKGTAKVKVQSSGLGDYVSEIIRIESVRNESGEEVYKRSLIGRYLKAIDLPAPGTYSFKILCERWYLLEFKHPIVTATLAAGENYKVTCSREGGEVKAEINLK